MGLAYETTGKYVSERHTEAAESGMLTAGQVAKILSKKFKVKVSAKELKPFAAEWHHSGFYKGGNGSTMGRTYFFSPATDLDSLYRMICAAREAAAKLAAEPEIEVYIFKAGFKITYTGRNGRKRWQPVAKFEVLSLPQSEAACQDGSISKEDYELLKQFEGTDLESYESFTHFRNRMLEA